MYKYKVKLLRVIDGDTIKVDIDLGFGIVLQNQTIRLAKINAPEINTEEGKKSKEFLIKMLDEIISSGKDLIMLTSKDRKDKYGRYLGTFILNDKIINEILVISGHAQFYE